jgi:glycosyltransferase involved in cell wall biosynthesis
VSVVVPVFNGERFLGEALQSVVTQTIPPAEIIVVDDGSTDGTAEVARRFGGVRYVAQPHAGIAAARNRGVDVAGADCLSFLDADDWWPPEKLEIQTAALERDPAIDVVLGHCVEVSQSEWIAPRPHATERAVPAYLASACLVRRGAFDRVGPFATTLRAGEFIDWVLRARSCGLRILVPPEVVLWRRVHDANYGVTHRVAYEDYARVLKGELDRRRGRHRP